jgi:uncharacterized protein YdhG (YjbR/CyaY superfamily)
MDKNKKAYKTAEEYIRSFPEHISGKLTKLREVIIKSAPEAEEIISYGMPAYKYHGIVAYFAASKNHYALYAYPDSIKAFQDDLKSYSLSKGTIRFTYDKPLPVKLVTDIIRYRVNGNLAKKGFRDESKKKVKS